jgi:hypothetical protein
MDERTMTKREPVGISLRTKKLVDFGPPTTIKIERSLDTWVRNYCLTSGRTFRSVLEEGLQLVRTKTDLALPLQAERRRK